LKKLILKCGLSLGDIVMLTTAVRDLHLCYPGKFATDVRTSCAQLWENSPYVTSLTEDDPEAQVLDCSYPLINRCNDAPYHCLHGFIEFLNDRLNLAIKPTAFKGDVHLSAQEKAWFSQVHELTRQNIPFWVLAAGGKYDITIKWWSAERYQQVVDHFRGKIQFVQVGAYGDHHPRIKGAIDLRGQTDLRELIRLVYHSKGVLCSVTGLMHLAAAVQTKKPLRGERPCVIVAGGREPAHWEAYPGHQFIHNNGALPCSVRGGCWKDRTVRLRDGDERDGRDHLCVSVAEGLPRCMGMITASEVIARIETYFRGGTLKYLTRRQRKAAQFGVVASAQNRYDEQPLTIHNAGMACDHFIRSIPSFPEGRFNGRGIVICGGGSRYFTNAWVCIHMLRHAGCRLPVQLWHLGRKELDERMRSLMAPLDVECIDAHRLRKNFPARILHGWELKSYAMLHSSFHEVLLLDADNVPVANPERLFETDQFKATGVIFWPDYDYPSTDKKKAIWRSCGLREPRENEFETGQIVLDKRRCWRALNLTMWLNENSDFYYRYLHGDKEMFHLAFRKLHKSYSLIENPIHRLQDTMCQHDFNGRRLFQHRNMDKWDLSLANKRIKDFWFEEECRGFVLRLSQLWDGKIAGAGSNPKPALRQSKPLVNMRPEAH
jgi:ADP-heptose:LPS heptosyltransferase